MGKVWDVIGYSFDGALYCEGCALGKFAGSDKRRAQGCTCAEADANGICAENCHGYGPNPIFADAEAGDTPDTCDTCGELLETSWTDVTIGYVMDALDDARNRIARAEARRTELLRARTTRPLWPDLDADPIPDVPAVSAVLDAWADRLDGCSLETALEKQRLRRWEAFRERSERRTVDAEWAGNL